MAERPAVRIAVLTISDTRDDGSDRSGAYLAKAVSDGGHIIADRKIVPDAVNAIQDAIKTWSQSPDIDLIISTGGTGLTGRDVTPEAVEPLFDKAIDGFAAIWHMISFESIGLSTMQSRACAGIVNSTLIFCLPGSPGAVRDGWTKVIAPQLDPDTKPCNLLEIMPRMGEL
jgi:molybdenum cofactor biosynthesis protein B